MLLKKYSKYDLNSNIWNDLSILKADFNNY